MSTRRGRSTSSKPSGAILCRKRLPVRMEEYKGFYDAIGLAKQKP
jgi:hypothetical protein